MGIQTSKMVVIRHGIRCDNREFNQKIYTDRPWDVSLLEVTQPELIQPTLDVMANSGESETVRRLNVGRVKKSLLNSPNQQNPDENLVGPALCRSLNGRQNIIIVTSPFRRCVQTAALIAKKLSDSKPGCIARVVVHPGLGESGQSMYKDWRKAKTLGKVEIPPIDVTNWIGSPADLKEIWDKTANYAPTNDSVKGLFNPEKDEELYKSQKVEWFHEIDPKIGGREKLGEPVNRARKVLPGIFNQYRKEHDAIIAVTHNGIVGLGTEEYDRTRTRVQYFECGFFVVESPKPLKVGKGIPMDLIVSNETYNRLDAEEWKK